MSVRPRYGGGQPAESGRPRTMPAVDLILRSRAMSSGVATGPNSFRNNTSAVVKDAIPWNSIP